MTSILCVIIYLAIRCEDCNCHINLWKNKQDFRRFLCMGYHCDYCHWPVSWLCVDGKHSVQGKRRNHLPAFTRAHVLDIGNFFLFFFFTINFSVSALMAYHVLTCWLTSLSHGFLSSDSTCAIRRKVIYSTSVTFFMSSSSEPSLRIPLQPQCSGHQALRRCSFILVRSQFSDH